MVIVDRPGKLAAGFTDARSSGRQYHFLEFQLGDVFMLDVSTCGTGQRLWPDDYANSEGMSRKGRWNLKDRLKKFDAAVAAGEVALEVGPLAAGRAAAAELWPLYQQTGEKNGFTVLTEAEFYEFHAEVPDLLIMKVYALDKEGGGTGGRKLVSFCTGVRYRDVLMPMWCGQDYGCELVRTKSTYFVMLYSYVKLAMADAAVRWVDLGATRRTAKTAIGFVPHPMAG